MGSRPRVIYLLHNPPHIRCGTELHTKSLFEGLREHYDTWLLFRDREQDAIFLTNDGSSAWRLPADRLAQPEIPYDAPTTTDSLNAAISRVRPDLVHIQHVMNWPLNVMDLVLATAKPVVLTLHDSYTCGTGQHIIASDGLAPATATRTLAPPRDGRSEYHERRREILRASISRVSARIAPSRFHAASMAAHFHCAFDVIPHGIPSFESPARNTPPDRLVFGFVGHLEHHKGWHLLAEAFREIRKTHQHVELHFFGSPRRDHAGGPGIVFHGRYHWSQLPEIYSKIDVAVIPSVVEESFCLALSEAWMAQRPVAVADIGALGERVADGVNGRKFHAGDVGSLHATMRWFLENDSWRNWSIDRPTTTEAMCNDHDKLYRSLLRDRS